MSPPLPESAEELPIAVIGGGATGLATAYAIARAGKKVRLFERSSRTGGAVKSESVEGWLVEAGPNSIQENAAEIFQLEESLGLLSQRVVADSAAKKRYIVRSGQMCALPASPIDFFFTRTFSVETKLLVLRELFRRPRARPVDVSIARLIDEHFGPEIVNFLLDPFVSGIYAGNSKKLSARLAFPKLWECEKKYGSLLRGMATLAKARRADGKTRGELISFQGGLQALTSAMQNALPASSIECDANVESIIPGKDWKIVWRRGQETHTETFRAVALALPARSLARITVGSLAERPLAGLEEIIHPEIVSLFLGFRREQIAHPLDGFGVLIPRAENKKILGVLFSSSLFAGRAPAGHVALTVFLSGKANSKLVENSLEELTAVVMAELRTLLGIKGEPVFRRANAWPHAIPQYDLGYEKYLEAMASCEKNYPGLLIAGQARDGISLPACLLAGLAMGKKAVAQ